ncbi:uncharacterized protein LOC126718145 [Quercus robur]|uniref:uncharacterized protein LOC126718145 n=1 Tax=Quercus robur TaxID=38942 RepID=UPI002163FA61|nr:uncharacterized protein LOC126718145 [Quercus robur]
MESNQKVELELINMAIQRLVEEKKIKEASSTDCLDDQLLLSKLLSQLESLKGDGTIKEPEASTEASTEIDEVSPTAVCNVDNKMENAGQLNGGSNETESEIVKELKKVKRQNFVTHCLLSVLIVLTAAWQVSEVKLILKVKEGFNHPFQSFGSLLTGMLKGPNKNGEDAEKQSSHAKQQIEAPPLPDLKIPELPRVDLPDLRLNGENK